MRYSPEAWARLKQQALCEVCGRLDPLRWCTRVRPRATSNEPPPGVEGRPARRGGRGRRGGQQDL